MVLEERARHSGSVSLKEHRMGVQNKGLCNKKCFCIMIKRRKIVLKSKATIINMWFFILLLVDVSLRSDYLVGERKESTSERKGREKQKIIQQKREKGITIFSPYKIIIIIIIDNLEGTLEEGRQITATYIHKLLRKILSKTKINQTQKASNITHTNIVTYYHHFQIFNSKNSTTPISLQVFLIRSF